jgi:hypothetical protein
VDRDKFVAQTAAFVAAVRARPVGFALRCRFTARRTRPRRAAPDSVGWNTGARPERAGLLRDLSLIQPRRDSSASPS